MNRFTDVLLGVFTVANYVIFLFTGNLLNLVSAIFTATVLSYTVRRA